VLDLSKIEAGQLQVERIRCSPHQVISSVVSSLGVNAERRGISFAYHWTTGVPKCIRTDPHRLQQLLTNLVGNAIKFTEQGRVSVEASFEVQGDKGQLAIAISDTGVGISDDALDSIFLPFVQADDTVTRRFGGTGLGLAISRKLAEALGGKLTVTSQLGVGSTFTATIATGDLRYTTILTSPLSEENRDATNQSAELADLTGVRVLLVEDGDTNRKLVNLLLMRRGAEVAMAEHGEIALQLAEEREFDVVIMDMQMPIMDGYTAARRLRERDFTGPIIALTAHAMKGDREKCHEAGCSDYLSKPIDADTLIAKVAEAVDVNRAAAAAFVGSRA
jgi:CheY-like chemotaxis protein/anti-sigma regulatory factor (Ser/Thr protein kinase)